MDRITQKEEEGPSQQGPRMSVWILRGLAIFSLVVAVSILLWVVFQYRPMIMPRSAGGKRGGGTWKANGGCACTPPPA